MRVWRIYDKGLTLDQTISGWGAFAYGGRWNSEGLYVVYTSECLSLAAFEKLVHIEDEEALITNYLKLSIEIPDELVEEYPLEEPPDGWQSLVDNTDAQAIGDEWLQNPDAPLALKVPSVVIPEESNILVNPKHDLWGRLEISDPSDFNFDSRLIGFF